MINENKKLMRLNPRQQRNKTTIENENSFQSFSKPNNKRTESLPTLPNYNKLKENNPYFYNQSYNINSKDIKEIHIDLKNIPKRKNKSYKVINKRNKMSNPPSQNNSLSFGNKMNNSFSHESINTPRIYKTNTNISDSLINFQNNTYTQPIIETYEIKFGKNKRNRNAYKSMNREKESESMDIPYYRPTGYTNRNEISNNSFWKKFDNTEYYSHNNSFNINRTNIDEDFKLNNTMNYNHDKNIKRKNSLTTINSIPKPQNFRKKIPPIPRKSNVSSNNNSFYFEETNNNSNININNNNYNPNIRYYDTKTVNNTDIYKYNKKIFNKKSIKDYNNNNNKIYSNKTHSPKVLKDIEKMGIKLSFNKRKKNDSIDLISPELFNDLKSYSYDKPKKQIIFSDLDINKVNECNNNNNIQNNFLFNNKMENYDKMRKKYIKRLSSYLLKNRRNKLNKKKDANKKGKYDIIDIKEKIKDEKRNRSISNTSKFKKKEIVKDSPYATSIKKEDDKGGKIDFKMPTINMKNKNNKYRIKSGLKNKYLSKNNKSNQSSINNDKNVDKTSLNAAKTIQKWWRSILIKFFTELNIIKIQSVFRSYILRKKLSKIKNNNNDNNNNNHNNNINNNTSKIKNEYTKEENIIKIILIQKKWREYYLNSKKKKQFMFFSTNDEERVYKKLYKYQYKNYFYRDIIQKNIVQQNHSFGIMSNNKRNSCNNSIGKNFYNSVIKDDMDNNNNNNKDNNDNNNYNNKNINYPSLIQYKNETFEIKNHIDDNEDIYNSLKPCNENDILPGIILIDGKNELKPCFYTKEYYKNLGENEITCIQRAFRKYLNNKNNNSIQRFPKNQNSKLPILNSSYIDKVRLIKTNNFSKNNNKGLSINRNTDICFVHNKNDDSNNNNNPNKGQNSISSENKKSIPEDDNKQRTSNFLLNKKSKEIKKVDNSMSTNPVIINYIHDIDFSINKDNNIKPIKPPLIQECSYTKTNILTNQKPIEYTISKINSETYTPTYKKNNILEITPIYNNELKGYEKTEPQYKISKNSNNYIQSSSPIAQDKTNSSYNNNYMVSNYSNETKGKPKEDNLYEICTIHSNNFSIKDNNNNKEKDKNNNLEIDNQNKELNYLGNKKEPIIKIPIQKGEYITKNIIVIDDYYKHKDITSKLKTKLLKNNNEHSDDKNYCDDDDNNNDNAKSNNEEIYKYPLNKNACYISKICKNDNSIKEIITLQKYYKKLFNKKNEKLDKTYNRLMILNNFITKEYKDSSLDKKKIILIQKFFRKFLNNKKNDLDRYKKNHFNNKRIITNKNNMLSRNNSSRNSFSSSHNSLKNTNTYENIPTNYGTSENINKAIPIYPIKDNNDNFVKNKNIINKYENRKFSGDSNNENEKYKDEEEKSKDKENEKDEKEKNKDDKDEEEEKENEKSEKDEDEDNNEKTKKYIDEEKRCDDYDKKYKNEYENKNNDKDDKEENNEKNEIKEGSDNEENRKDENDKDDYEDEYEKSNLDNNEKERNKIIYDAIKTAYQINIYKNKREEPNEEEEKNNKDYNNIGEEDKIKNINNLYKIFYIKQVLYKLRKKINRQKQNNMLKMLIQRIKKNVNQYVFQKIQIHNYFNKNKQSLQNFDNMEDSEDKDNILMSMSSDYEPKKENFFFNTIKRHLKINKEDNNWQGDNEIIKLLKISIPDYFKNYPEKKYIPYIHKKQEKNLVDNQLYLFDDDKLADYMYKCYKIERNVITITTDIIKNRLIKNPLKNQNLFTITRYMDNLYNDITNGNICQKCCCKNNELCLVGCTCHKNNNEIISDNINNSNKNSMKNYIITTYTNNTGRAKIRDKEIIKFQVLKRFIESEESSEFNDSIINQYNIKVNDIHNSIKSKNIINNENLDNNNDNNEEGQKRPIKNKNYIKEYILKKKKRTSLKSNASNASSKSNKINQNNENEEIKIVNHYYNYNNNIKEISTPKMNLDYEQCNVYDDEDVKNNEEEKDTIKKINNSLSKKKIGLIIPISNSNRMIINKVNTFRYEQDQSRRKYREIIKLRETNINYDNEIYENI